MSRGRVCRLLDHEIWFGDVDDGGGVFIAPTNATHASERIHLSTEDAVKLAAFLADAHPAPPSPAPCDRGVWSEHERRMASLEHSIVELQGQLGKLADNDRSHVAGLVENRRDIALVKQTAHEAAAIASAARSELQRIEERLMLATNALRGKAG